ncbi:hypothetical protein H8S75_14855 [Hungatella sp. L12]|uniref:Uncharacterized protein n=1 Tax=Hungatella hominis TaxID=2763050 RepID=A0ABR7H7R6_9FIRM|nr:hypothetical protein [Hungatella hominis]MBC5709235.1 hypothetical protein [Hungatella hominis]
MVPEEERRPGGVISPDSGITSMKKGYLVTGWSNAHRLIIHRFFFCKSRFFVSSPLPFPNKGI